MTTKKDCGKKCIIPWMHLHTWPNKNVYPCCMGDMNESLVGSLANNSLEEIWNNDKMRELRVDMLNDVENDMCKRCWTQENSGHPSLRNSFNENYEHLHHRWDQTQADGTTEYAPVYWDFRFSNICNMRCRSCGPQLSSGWYEDTKKRWGSLPQDVGDLTDRTPELWEQIEPLFETVEEIYFAGGEPLIMEEHYRILNRLIEMGRTHVKLRYNSNMSRLRYKNLDIISAWQHFENVEVGASLDSWGERAEYIRKGTIWPDIEANMLRIRREAPHVRMYISATVGIFNSLTLREYYTHMVNKGIIKPYEMWFNPIQEPPYLAVHNLPVAAKQLLTEQWNDWAADTHHSIKPQLASLIKYMGSSEPQHLEKFLTETHAWDRIRGEQWRSVFPELSRLIEVEPLAKH